MGKRLSSHLLGLLLHHRLLRLLLRRHGRRRRGGRRWQRGGWRHGLRILLLQGRRHGGRRRGLLLVLLLWRRLGVYHWWGGLRHLLLNLLHGLWGQLRRSGRRRYGRRGDWHCHRWRCAGRCGHRRRRRLRLGRSNRGRGRSRRADRRRRQRRCWSGSRRSSGSRGGLSRLGRAGFWRRRRLAGCPAGKLGQLCRGLSQFLHSSHV
jgi:hypothetical protein